MKIVYCLNSIRYLGGIQRVTITKANALAELPGNEVHIVVTDNNEDNFLVQPLSDKVHLTDLGINYYDGDSNRSRIGNILVYASKRRKHRVLLYDFLKRIRPDVVISVGQSEKYMLLSMPNRSWKVIREFHFERNYRKKMARSRIDKLIAVISDYYDFNFKEKRYDKIVVLTDEDRCLNWQGWNNVAVVPNPISFKSQDISNLNNKVIVSLGRLDFQKNYSSLIRVFIFVCRNHSDWVLKIYGEGSQREQLQRMIDNHGLNENIKLMGKTDDVIQVLNEASIFVLSSIMEGFALVIVEAMECGLPVVSYQCPCGPQDIITGGIDGFLVPVGDEIMMAERICTLIEDEELRRNMGAAAKEKAKRYHIEKITQQWMRLFEDVVEK